jgi:uncharacterized protein
MSEVSAFLEQVVSWASERPDVHAVGLAGSWARGTTTPESDVDLVVSVESLRALLADDAWLAQFGEVVTASNEDWGLVRSRRVHYAEGLEVEFGLTTTQWAIVPPDPGTRQVLADGFEILFDPDGLLRRCGAACQ